MAAAAGREALIQELLAGREAVLQAIWAHQLIRRQGLRTVGGSPLRVQFPGWLNREAGPDFRNAQLLIGGVERRGDVEIHVHPRDWRAHGHGADPAYANVVLHVVLRAHEQVKAVSSEGGGRIPELELATCLAPGLAGLLDDPQGMLRRYADLPGRCGMSLLGRGPEALLAVIAGAAETRAKRKADAVAAEWRGETPAQLLYELLFQSLGYRPYAAAFRALARRFPLRDVEALLGGPYGDARQAVLARWFGALGLLQDEQPGCSAVGLVAEYRAWREHWLALGQPPLTPAFKRAPARPWNSPERRLVGLFHHLYAARADDWFKVWLGRLHALDGLRDQPDLRNAALKALEGAFDTPGWEPWRNMVSFQRDPLAQGGQLIGRDRISIIVANAVIPLFLAYARHGGDADLERLLYRLFIVLPPEAPNARTRFMEKRLLPLEPLPRNLRTQQGLLQIHQDFCNSYEEGCADCSLPDLMRAART
ncbi:MAG: DUF2851 family protein [Candidatus Lambdaproteobacteria bacterium]|nr:DUF2851 family protein [Candidatus Lambdaproteobacteria bacterium]